jgi:hypothetical protein
LTYIGFDNGEIDSPNACRTVIFNLLRLVGGAALTFHIVQGVSRTVSVQVTLDPQDSLRIAMHLQYFVNL